MVAQPSVGLAVMAAHAEGKAAAILVADIVSYTQLVGTDDVGTTARLKALRGLLVEPTIGEYRGRVVRLTDECMLVEFARAADAVECAVAIQKGMAEREVDVGEAGRIRYRVGVNFGSINVKGDDTLGDEVDNAARLATLAEPGGICIARPVYDEVKSELKLQYEHHRDWMHIALMSTNTPDAWPTTMDLIEISAVKINAAAMTGQRTDDMFERLWRHIRRLLDWRVR
jgi:class 3 adenylate cyclase